jgi:integrase
MASITKLGNGRKRLAFNDPRGQRQHVRLGKMPMKLANEVRTKVEEIVAARLAGHQPSPTTQQWIGQQRKDKTKLIEKLADLGLIHREYLPDVPDTLEAFITEYIGKRTDVKEGTLVTYLQVRKRLVDHFGADRRLSDITTGEGKQWRRWLLEKGLAEATVNRSCSSARQFFNEAIDQKVLSSNPFDGLPVVVRGNEDRFYFIDHETAEKVLDACPNAEWRLLVGLARYGGLRIPSESSLLRWGDIDWDNEIMTITSPKTEHHQGKGMRFVPIFPELRTSLIAAFEIAEEGSEFVIPSYRKSTQNLRTQFQRIIKRAGIEPWPKLWQNLRSSRATDLADNGYPEHVISKWIGNTPKVAKEHYLQVTPEHLSRAVTVPTSKAQGGAKCAPVPSGLDVNRPAQSFRRESVTADSARRNTHMHTQVGVTRWARQDSNL